MIRDICIGVDTINAENLLEHFNSCDVHIENVDLLEHSIKLRRYATTIEAWEREILVGLAACYLNRPELGVAFITHIAILPKYQRKGIGRLLIRKVAELAKAKSFSELILEVKKNNEKALKFYFSMGFAVNEDRGDKYLMGAKIDKLKYKVC